MWEKAGLVRTGDACGGARRLDALAQAIPAGAGEDHNLSTVARCRDRGPGAAREPRAHFRADHP